MAGAGYKLFNTGDVLTAAQVNTYLMQQTVMVFASSAARTTALSGVLAEGMVSYLQDSNTLEVYDGSAWVGATGDITGLTAGTGITITNATGPVPTVTNDVVTTIDAKGDLIVGTGDNTYVRQAVGSNNQVLMADSAQSDGVKWANEATATLTAKGDILSASGANTLARLAVGNSGETIVADSSASTGLRWQGSMAAGKNAIINGGFDIWQRGTASQTPANGQQMNCDRFYFTGGGGVVFTQDTDVPTDPYFQYSLKTVDGANYGMSFAQKIEAANAVLLAGKTVTVSFYAKMTSGTATMYVNAYYPSAKDNFASLTTIASNTVSTPTSSWARYQTTFSLPSNVQNGLVILIGRGSTSNTTFYTGIQVELGSIATPFTRAGGTLAGELAAAMRYFYSLNSANNVYTSFGNGVYSNTTTAQIIITLPVPMRVTPSISVGTVGNYAVDGVNGNTCSNLVTGQLSPQVIGLSATTASQTAGYACYLRAANTLNAAIQISAEL